MIASQFNLDTRLAELLQTEPGHDVGSHRSSTQPSGRPTGLIAAIRSLLASGSTGRPARIVAH